MEWQRHIARTLHDAEPEGARHLISMNIANGSVRVEEPEPLVSILNFHYSRPPKSVELNYALKRAVGMNETGFDGAADATYRIQGWDFLMTGGALYNNLDYSFTVGHEDGTFQYPSTTPGGGTASLRTQLGFLRRFFDAFDLDRTAPDRRVLARLPAGATFSARALSDGRRYAVYLHRARVEPQPKPHFVVESGSRSDSLPLALPPGAYGVSWIDPKSGRAVRQERLQVATEALVLASPEYSEDLVLELRRAR